MVGSRLQRLVGPDRRWVVPQLILLPIVLVTAPVESHWSGRRFGPLSPLVGVLAGLLCFGLAGWVAWRARRDLAENLTMSPTPVEDGTLIDNGVYARVRHPMYAAVLLSTLGNALCWGSSAGLAGTALTAVFLALKTRHEEDMLRRRYPEYATYQQLVRWRFLPGVF